MVDRKPRPPVDPDAGMKGPYSTDMGQDAYGHPTNAFGRCQQLNETGVCPTLPQQTTYLLGLPNDTLLSISASLGITIPLVHPNSILVPLILAVTFPS